MGAVRPTVDHISTNSANNHPQSSRVESKKPTHKATHHNVTRVAGEAHMRKPIDWKKSSETVDYPNLAKVKHFWVKVSISKNRTYLYDGKKVIYTMYSSAGRYHRDPKTDKKVSYTPTGTFHVEQERGENFYNQKLNEGANYYTSWLNHGEYLFHSVPTKPDGTYNLKEAKKLGKSTGSHGCVRLSVPDAHWMMVHLPVGTKVKIEK